MGDPSLETGNRIAGESLPAASGHAFETRARRFPWRGERRWPRSGPEDVERALAAAEDASRAWLGLGRARRLACLARAAEELAGAQAARALAGALGLEDRELGPLHSELDFRLREGLELWREGPERPGALPPVAFGVHWSELAAGALMRLAPRLLAGHPVLVWSDPALPEGGVLLVRALERAGLPPGTAALLHDDLLGSLAYAGARVPWLRLRGPGERLGRLRRALPGVPAGAGPELSLWPLQDATAVVLEAEAPDLRARELVLKALGRSGTLGGQMPGQVGRVICHQRLFSRFSEEFLHGLEAGLGSAPERPSGAPAAPGLDRVRPLLPTLDGDLPGYVRRAWDLGIDEGATPIHGGEPLVGLAEAPALAPEPDCAVAPAELPAKRTPELPFGAGLEEEARHGRAPAVVRPVVFTNVDPDLRLARLRRPSPVVLLLRAASDDAARELATWLEGVEEAGGEERSMEAEEAR